MKVRKNKHKILDRMANPSWKEDLNKMWFIRGTTPCKSYSPWCPDCNARLFYKELKRFPYSYEEWRVFELRQAAPEEAEFNRLEDERNRGIKELSDAAKFRELSNQLEDFAEVTPDPMLEIISNAPPLDPAIRTAIGKLIMERNVND